MCPRNQLGRNLMYLITTEKEFRAAVESFACLAHESGKRFGLTQTHRDALHDTVNTLTGLLYQACHSRSEARRLIFEICATARAQGFTEDSNGSGCWYRMKSALINKLVAMKPWETTT